jgi:hypothetical protein
MRVRKFVVLSVVALAVGCQSGGQQAGPPAGPEDYVLSVPGMH